MAWLDRQHLLGPVQRLDLALLVHTQHHSVVRRCQIQADHVGDLRERPLASGGFNGAAPGWQPALKFNQAGFEES